MNRLEFADMCFGPEPLWFWSRNDWSGYGSGDILEDMKAAFKWAREQERSWFRR